MCAWPAARRRRPPWYPSRWDRFVEWVDWRLEVARTCWRGKHMTKMDGRGRCYRCGKPVHPKSVRFFCAYCAEEQQGPGLAATGQGVHTDWCPRNDGIPEP